ncbi:MAG: outer membrane protein assembly factor BamD [Chlamydiota bacterium]|nr:outer membrane protein assembly factor BamD [Chlamydiota bacterium]
MNRSKYINVMSVISIICFLFCSADLQAVWVWDAKTGKWGNPKYEVKSTPKLQYKNANNFEKKKEWDRAAKEYKKLRQNFPRSKYAPEAILHEAENFEKAGFYYESFQAYQVLISKYPSYREISEIVAQQYRIGNLYLTGKKRKMKYIKLAVFSALNEAIEIFEKVRDNLPFSDIADDAQFRIGLTYEKMNKLNQAIQAYRELLRKFSESELRDDAKYRIGMCYLNLSKGPEYDQASSVNAIAAFHEFLNEYPDSNRIEEVKQRISDLHNSQAKGIYDIACYYDKIKQYDSALIYYNRVVNDFSESTFVQNSQKRVAQIQQKQQKITENK